MTIKELVEKHGFGIKVYVRGHSNLWAIVLSEDLDQGYVVLKHDNTCMIIPPPSCRNDYELYIEPKPKVMRAQYAYKFKIGKVESDRPTMTGDLYKDDDEFKKVVGKVKWFKRLTEIECED